jgi:hypothetical protein
MITIQIIHSQPPNPIPPHPTDLSSVILLSPFKIKFQNLLSLFTLYIIQLPLPMLQLHKFTRYRFYSLWVTVTTAVEAVKLPPDSCNLSYCNVTNYIKILQYVLPLLLHFP